MTDDIMRASPAVADTGCVRFTVFFELKGPQVFEVTEEALRAYCDARGGGAEQLLESFRRHESEILAVARSAMSRGHPAVLRLTTTDFQKSNDRSSATAAADVNQGAPRAGA